MTQIDESFLITTGLAGRLSSLLAYDLGLCVPLKAQSEERSVLIENPFYFKFQFDS